MVSLPAEKIRHVFRTLRCGAGPRCRKGVCLMKNVLRSTLTCLAACLAVCLAASNAAAAGGPLLEKEVEVPRATRIPLDLTWGKCVLVDVETQNPPGEKAVLGAKEHTPKNLTFFPWRFHYKNSDWIGHRVRLRAV